MKSPAKVGWVVDAQVDFMSPEGRLYVRDLGSDVDPGCVQIIPTLERAVAWMRKHCDVMVFTSDWHGLGDEEIDPLEPDPAKGTYPPHCMGRSEDPAEREGAQIVLQIRPEVTLDLELGAADDVARDVAAQALREGHPIRILKNRFDVFAGNGATPALLQELEHILDRPLEFIVAGVARDVCVTQAVDGLQARGYRVTALRDATWGLGLEPESETLGRWAAKGRVATLSELE
jgi:nicotinamidase-related amidase